MKRFIAIALVAVLIALSFVACASSATRFYGVWECYKMCDDSGEIVISENKVLSGMKMEMTAEFSENGEYEIHCYYFGAETSSAYPKIGKYRVDGKRIVLIDDDAYGEIVNGELILYFSNGVVKHYFTSKA